MVKKIEAFKHIRLLQMIANRHVDTFFSGIYRSVFKGNGLEFEDVREYRQGDDIRLMNWNVTARSAVPYIKTFREERELGLMLVVDVSASSRFGHTDRLKSETIAELGAILAFSAIRNQDKVGLLLFSGEIELFLKPAKGTRHVLRVIRELLYFVPKFPGTDLKKALLFLGSVQKRRSICFIISDFLSDDFEVQLTLTAKKEELIGFHVYDSYEMQFTPRALVTLQDLETGEETIADTADPLFQNRFEEQSNARINNLRKLFLRSGADFVSVNTSESSSSVLQRFFQLKKCRLNRRNGK